LPHDAPESSSNGMYTNGPGIRMYVYSRVHENQTRFDVYLFSRFARRPKSDVRKQKLETHERAINIKPFDAHNVYAHANSDVNLVFVLFFSDTICVYSRDKNR